MYTGPLKDGMVVSLPLLSTLIRQTCINAHRDRTAWLRHRHLSLVATETATTTLKLPPQVSWCICIYMRVVSCVPTYGHAEYALWSY